MTQEDKLQNFVFDTPDSIEFPKTAKELSASLGVGYEPDELWEFGEPGEQPILDDCVGAKDILDGYRESPYP